MMVQWVIEMLRNRQKDQTTALHIVRQSAESAVRASMTEYDAFVASAKSVHDGLLLGTARSSDGEEIPIYLPWGNEYAHWIVQGGTGAGKTTWITSLLAQKLRNLPPCVGTVDFKSDLYDASIRTVAAFAHTLDPATRDDLRKGLVVVNPFSNALTPFNVCCPLPGVDAEFQAFEIGLALARMFDNELGVHQENVLRHLLILLIESRLSLVEAPLLLKDEILLGLLAVRSTNPAVKEFFLGYYCNIPQVSKDALLNRLNALLLSESVRLMLGADGLVDLRGVLSRGDVLVVFLGKGPGVAEELVEILGRLFLNVLFQAVFGSGSGRGRGYLLFLDEFFHLLDGSAMAKRFQTALSSARSYGMSLALVNQNFAQLSAPLREMILGNCDLAALFKTNQRNAEFFGDILPEVEPDYSMEAQATGASNLWKRDTKASRLEALQRLPNRTCYWYDRRKPYRALRLTIPTVPMPHEAAGLSESALETVIREEGWDRGAAAVPRDQLRAQIEARQKRLRELLRPEVRVSSPRKRTSPNDETSKGKPKLG